MSNIFAILLLTVFQFIAGFGITSFFKIHLRAGLFLPLCLLLGIAIFSFIPFALQLLYIPLSSVNIFTTLFFVCAALNFRTGVMIERLAWGLRGSRFTMRLYEIPFLLVITIIVLISVWRCFYLPPTPRDLTSGAETVAEYAVREKTMINSVFTINLETTNNQFKPPFITSLQIIYKLAGLPFGQVWLSAIFVSFIIFLYHALSITLHKLIAGLLIIAFLAIPEMYAYTFMVLFDYSNAVFFFLSLYFLITFFASKQLNHLAFAGLLMAIATYIRSETLILAGFIFLAVLLYQFKYKGGIKLLLQSTLLFLAPALVIYLLSITIYVNHYLPVKYDVGELINPHLLNLKPFFTRFWGVNKQLIFSRDGISYYGYFIFLFCAFFLAELIIRRRFTSVARNWLFAILVIYIGLPLLGFVLPLMDLENTTKRGLFKMFPLMLLYMANNGLLVELSRRITAWETTTKKLKAVTENEDLAGAAIPQSADPA